MTVSLFDIVNNMSFVGWLVAVVSIFVTLLSVVVFWQDSTKRSNKSLLFLGIIIGVWGVAYSFFDGSIGTQSIHTAVFILYLTAAAVPPAVFLFLHVFSTEKRSSKFWKFIVLFVPYLLIGGALLTSDLIVGYNETINSGIGDIVPGRWYLVYVCYVVVFLLVGVSILAKKYKESVGTFKIAIGYFMTAILFTSAITIATSLISPLFGAGHSLFWIGHLSIALLGVAITYVLLQYNFWSIKVIGIEFFVSIITLVLIAELFQSMSVLNLFVRLGVTLLVVLSSPFLVRGVKKGIQSGERITRLRYELGATAEQLKVLDRKKSDFLSIASHHLRDPLTAIKGYASMLSEGSFGQLSPQVSEAIDKIFESSERLITMISDFLDISRIESGEMNYKFTDVDLKEVVLGLENEMKINAEKAHISFSTTVDAKSSDSKFVTVGDPGKLRQVISNLIDNAIKYTPRGEVTVLLSKSNDGKKIIFSVSDTGVGMSEDTLKKIFMKFSRAGDANKSYTEGRGLGLYVGMEIVKKHEGRIWAESKGEGLGSSFFVELDAKM